jgi:hypothetical protein
VPIRPVRSVAAIISKTALIPTNVQAKIKRFFPAIKPCRYSVFAKNKISDEVKRMVLKRAAQNPVIYYAT